MKCCGEERSGKFCSECGERIGHPLAGLLGYAERNAGILRTKLSTRDASNAKHLADKPDCVHQIHQRRKTAERNATKWRVWVDELRKLIDAS